MNKYGLLLVLLILPQPVLHADHARQMAEAFEMRGLSDVVRDQAREVLSKVMGEKFGTWMVEKLEQKAKEIAASMPDKKINVRQLIQTGKLSPEEFKQALREKLRDYLPQAVKIILYDKLLQGELSGADQQYFEAIEKKITEILNLIDLRRNHVQMIVVRMKANQWLTDSEQKYADEDKEINGKIQALIESLSH